MQKETWCNSGGANNDRTARMEREGQGKNRHSSARVVPTNFSAVVAPALRTNAFLTCNSCLLATVADTCSLV